MLQVSKGHKRILAYLVGFMMIVGQSGYLSPSIVYGETGQSGSTETVYMLTDKLEAGQNYIVASGDSGSVSILERDGKTITSGKADVVTDENGTYIAVPSDDAVWTAEKGDGSGKLLVNEGYAVGLDENGDLALNKDSNDSLWSYNGGSQYLAATGGDAPVYMVFAKGFEASNDGDEVNLFVESEIKTGQDEDTDDERGPPEEDDPVTIEDEDTPTDNPGEAPAIKATGDTIGEPANGTVLTFTSDVHNAANNTAANRLDSWLVNVASIYGGINAMGFCGDMGSASAGESQFWDYTQAVMDVISTRGISGVYTTGNHEFYNGNYLSTSNSVKNKYVVGGVGKEGSNYIIYCMGTANWNNNSDNFTTDQITALSNYLDSVGTNKPIIVLVHFPLHRYNSRSTTNADKVIDALNDAADDGKKIVLLWGHNHTMSDTNYDQIFAPGDSITYNSSGASKEINFYYGAAGCMSDSEYGSGSAYVKGKGLVITINNKDQLSFTYYDANANNVTEGGTFTEKEPVAAEGIAVSPTAIEVEAGRTSKLAVTFTPADTTNKSVTWSTDEPTIASVDDKGKVKGLSEGSAVITATSADGGFTATCDVTVLPRTSAELNYVIKAGDYVLSTEASTDQATTSSSGWSSYVYTGLAAVADSPAAGTDEETRWIMEETEGGYYIKNLDGKYLNATYSSSGGSWNSSTEGKLKLDETSDVWVLDGNYLKSTNASNGNSSAKYLAEETGQAGTHLFTIRSKDNADEVEIEEAGDPVSVEGVSLDKETASVEAGKTVQLTATVTPENATNKSVTWKSSEKSIATVSAKGKVKGVAEGTAVITATTEDGGKTATCEVTVTPGTVAEPTYIIEVEGHALSSSRSDNTATGGSSSYTYTGLSGTTYTSGDADDSICWIIEETEGGYYIKSTNGLYLNATYTSGSNSGTGDLKLDDTQDVWVRDGNKLKSTNASGTATSDKYLAYEEDPANLFTVRSSSNADAVTITEVNGSSAQTTVDYVLTDKLEAGKEYLIANGNNNDVFIVSTEANGSKTLKGISATVSDNTITITEAAAAKAAFTCDLEDSGNANSTRLKNGDQYLYADSSNGLRMFTLTSSANGKHWHYKADGKNLLWFFKDANSFDGYTDTSSTYKYYLECSNTGNFTDAHVSTTSLENTNTPEIFLFEKTEGEPQPTVSVTGVTLDKGELSIEAGKSKTLTAEVEPSNATNKKVTWSSSNTNVATVENGVVKAVAKGTAVITVKTVDGEFTDTCDVTVTAPPVVEYTLTDKLEAGKEYLIANGNNDDVYVVSTEANGSKTLKGISATVSDNTITITEAEVAKAAFTCDLEDSENANSTRLKNGDQYLYTDSANGLRMFTLTSSADGKHWHYKADGKNLLWFFKDTNSSNGYTDTSSTYKYYLECSDAGNFTDAHVSTTSLENTNTPAIYLFVKSDSTQHEHTYSAPTWTWSDDHSTATATFKCADDDDTQTVKDNEPAETVVSEATCVNDKVVKYTAKVTFNEEEYTDTTEEITIEDTALGHDWGEWVVNKPATCTEKGQKCRMCGRCDQIETEEIAIVDHDWKHIVNKAGLLRDGSEYDQCTICKEIKNKKTLTGYATYYVKSPKTTKAKNAFTIKWTKQSKAHQKKFNGYQIRYSTKADMSGAKYVTAGNSSKSKKIGKLAKKTKYYVQVRTYTKSGGKTYYSGWSGTKVVVTK